MRIVVSLLLLGCIFFSSANATSALGGAAVLSVVASLNSLTDKKDSFLDKVLGDKPKIALKKVMLSIDEDMNNTGAVKMHLTIVYDQALMKELQGLKSDEYFRRIDQIIKDYPDKIKIFAWELVAKKRLVPLADVEYQTDQLTPLAGFIFVNYSGAGEHRAKIHESLEKIKILLQRDDFKVEKSDDKDEHEDEPESKAEGNQEEAKTNMSTNPENTATPGESSPTKMPVDSPPPAAPAATDATSAAPAADAPSPEVTAATDAVSGDPAADAPADAAASSNDSAA